MLHFNHLLTYDKVIFTKHCSIIMRQSMKKWGISEYPRIMTTTRPTNLGIQNYSIVIYNHFINTQNTHCSFDNKQQMSKSWLEHVFLKHFRKLHSHSNISQNGFYEYIYIMILSCTTTLSLTSFIILSKSIHNQGTFLV